MRLRLRDIVLGGLTLAVLYVFLWLYDFGEGDAEKLVRGQFHIPDSVKVTKLRYENKSPGVNPPTVSAIIQFSDIEFRDYVAHLNDPHVWSPQAITYDGTTFIGAWAPGALNWTTRDGNHELGWPSLSHSKIQTVRDGRLLCFGAYRTEAPTKPQTSTVQPCAAMTSAGSAVFIQGLIDPASRTLHIVIRGTL